MRSVASRDNATFKSMARVVASAAERRKSGLTVLDGTHLLAAYLDSGAAPEEIVVSRAGMEDAEVTRLLDRAAPARVTLLSDALFKELSTVDTPTVVMAA